MDTKAQSYIDRETARKLLAKIRAILARMGIAEEPGGKEIIATVDKIEGMLAPSIFEKEV